MWSIGRLYFFWGTVEVDVGYWHLYISAGSCPESGILPGHFLNRRFIDGIVR